jgi:hypothetical protein
MMPPGPLYMDARTGQLLAAPQGVAGPLPTYQSWSPSTLQLAHGGQLVPIQVRLKAFRGYGGWGGGPCSTFSA